MKNKQSTKNLLSGSVLTAFLFLAVSLSAATDHKMLQYENRMPQKDAIRVSVLDNNYNNLKAATDDIRLDFPIAPSENLALELENYNIFTKRARTFLGDNEIPRPDVVLLRGKIADQPHSRVCLGFTSLGSGGGYVVTEAGETYFLAQHPSEIGKPNGDLVIHKSSANFEPDFDEFCRVIMPDDMPSRGERFFGVFTDTIAGPRVAELAIEAEETFCNIFPDNNATLQYITLLFGVIGDIYYRDLDMKLMISFLRI